MNDPVGQRALRYVMETEHELFAIRFRTREEARHAVATIQSLIDCPLGAAFRQGPLEARIMGSSVEWEPLLYFSPGARAAARLAGLRLPEAEGRVKLERERHTGLLTIPRSPAAPNRVDEDGAMRVMIVEDHADTARMLADLVGAWGFRVEVATNGKEARTIAAAFQPRVVLLDLGLPDQNGYEVARDLRRTTGPDDLSFVVVTGWGAPEDHSATTDAGIAHHLVKPVDPGALRVILDRHRTLAA